jgi:biotin operon repressor
MPIAVRDRRGGHWAWFHHSVIDDYGAVIGPYGIAVYICLCRHVDREESTFVGQRTIATEIGSGRTSVNQAVAKLRELGLIDVEDRIDEHGRTTSTYTLLDPPLVAERASVTPPDNHRQSATRTANQFMNKNHGKRDTAQEYVTGRYGSVVARQQRQQDTEDG